MELFERLGIQAKNLTALLYRALGIHPERGEIIHEVLAEERPEKWMPLEIEESFINSGGIEVQARDLDGRLVSLLPGDWADRKLSQLLWETVVPFVIESSRGQELFVVENSNTMVYVPKCKLMISTGLSDGSVMKAITGNSGSQRFTKCPMGVLNANECKYPSCLGEMVTTSQPSIKAAKQAYRDSVSVCLSRNSNGRKMLFLTNGNNHLNLVNPEEAVEGAWSSAWLLNLRKILDELGFEEPTNLDEKLAVLTEEEARLNAEADQIYQKNLVEIAAAEEAAVSPENISLVTEKKPKARKSKKKAKADLSELDPEPTESKAEKPE